LPHAAANTTINTHARTHMHAATIPPAIPPTFRPPFRSSPRRPASPRTPQAFRADATLTANGAQIGITNNCDFTEPGSSDPADVAAATRANEWWLAWFTDPIWLGHYPASMVSKLGSRLPTFTAAEAAKLKGSADFFGLNHYGSRFARVSTKWLEPGSSGMVLRLVL
jgi:beta-glucosidase/6-phospho-beta-glucosidase/beta-galactosidase